MSETYSKESSPATKQQKRQARKAKRKRSEQRRRMEQVGEFQELIPEGREELLELMRDSMRTFAIEVGTQVAQSLLDDEVQRLCGAPYERIANRTASRHGSQSGFVVMAGQKVAVEKPRVRTTGPEGHEVDLATYARMQDARGMPEATLNRMVRGVSCRDYEGVVDLGCDGFGVKKSSVSRGFVRASRDALAKFAERRFDHLHFVAIFIDGIDFSGEMMVCALGLASDGTKHILGLKLGDTENAEVVKDLLAELRERGIRTDRPMLFVLDGSKALASGVKKVWGGFAVIQRCQIHKKRNVKSYLSKTHHAELDRRLNVAYQGNDYDASLEQLHATVKWLKTLNPDAATSLSEGLEDTLTVVRLGLSGALRKTLSTTGHRPQVGRIESSFDRARQVTGRVKRWRDGDMRHRWCLAGLQRAEDSFRRVRGHKDIPHLIKALESLALESSNSAA